GGGLERGDWGAWSDTCDPGCGICGIRTHVDPYDSEFDDSGLTDVRLYCCS
ncbi:VMO1 protein, partial [Bombycilla garrulus]|nr:VMO1 protein [Bombycilla garrulus]